MQVYDFVSDILTKKSGGTLYKDPRFKSFNSYMLCRYLSMKPHLIPFAEALLKYQSVLTDEQVYRWAYSVIPKQRSGFVTYMKPRKSKNKAEEKKAKAIADELAMDMASTCDYISSL